MASTFRHAVIIYNPTSGYRREQRVEHVNAAQRILREAGIEAALVPTRGRGTAGDIAREAVAAGHDLVIVCGGDGTINEVVNGLAGGRVPLAVLPAGTANVLAKELDIPWDIPAAARLIPSGVPRRIALGAAAAVGQAESVRHFLCVAGAGPDGAIVNAVNESLKSRTGQGAYWWEGFRQLVRYKFPLFRVTSPDLDREIEVSLAVVGRTASYGGPFHITTRASLFQDAFEIALLSTRKRRHYLKFLPALWLGRLRRQKGVFFVKTRTLRCELLNSTPVRAQADGEPCGQLPVEFRIVPDALTLLVPEKALVADAH